MAYKRILQNNSYTSYVFTYNVKQLIIYLIVETEIKKNCWAALFNTIFNKKWLNMVHPVIEHGSVMEQSAASLLFTLSSSQSWSVVLV